MMLVNFKNVVSPFYLTFGLAILSRLGTEPWNGMNRVLCLLGGSMPVKT
jgi:hypothetical protein